MTWRLAKSLDVLRGQINQTFPTRSKVSDGTIGDTAHSSRNSDHNPWVKDGSMGVVTALDITHDPNAGVDIQSLADALVASRDDRIKYIICNGKIVSGSGQSNPAWVWRNYTGANQHTRHIHVSVKSNKSAYDSSAPWVITGKAPGKVTPAQSTLKKNSKGPFVIELQNQLNMLGHGPLTPDGVFGAATEKAVKEFQASAGLSVDGWAGPRTLEALGAAAARLQNEPKIAAVREETKEVIEQEVKSKSNIWSTITGVVSSGGLGLGWLAGMDHQAILAIGAVVLVFMVVLFVMRKQIIAGINDFQGGLK